MSNIKHIVSMLASEQKITLFTVKGEVLELNVDGPHDTSKIAEFLTPQLNGSNVVEINLNEYLTLHRAIIPEGFENEGIVMTQIINGVEIQGIFYPSSVTVSVQYEGEEVIIPKVEKLEKHALRANSENSPAVRNFLKRMVSVAKERFHSAEDLMDFIGKSELPLTNDGKIIGYKKVNRTAEGKFVDVHSGKIAQQVGSHVWMDVDGVDPNRNKSCSHGLHVANLGYLSGFSGNHTLIVLVDPANFIAVPHGETNKARVCAYDVIGVMTARGHEMVESGSFVKEDQTFKSVIADAVAGRHVQPFEAIKVGQKEILEVKPINGLELPPTNLESTVSKTKESSGESLNSDAAPEKIKQKDIVKMARKATGTMPWDSAPKEVISVFEDLRQNKGSKSAIAALHGTSTRTIGRWETKYDYEDYVKSKESSLTLTEQARLMFTQGAFEALNTFKRAKRKSYLALGFNAKEEQQIMTALT